MASKKPSNITHEEWAVYKRVRSILMSEAGKSQKPRPREYYQRIANKRWQKYRETAKG